MPARHTVSGDYHIAPRAGLSGDELLQAAALKALCDAEDGLDLKVQPEMLRVGADAAASMTDAIVATTRDGALVGVCTLDGLAEVEICGMVHPAHRRRGIGRALLANALATCRERHARRMLVICEDTSASGRALLAAVLPAAPLAFKEQRLELRTPGFAPHTAAARVPGLVVRAADEGDLDALAATQAAAFGERKQGIRPSIAAELRDPGSRFYVAALDSVAVSSLKVNFVAPRAFVYAFGVVPEWRRRGIGRAVLAAVVARLRAEGWRRVALEVETENAPAWALYRSLGFAPVTTYGYYAVPG